MYLENAVPVTDFHLFEATIVFMRALPKRPEAPVTSTVGRSEPDIL